MPKIRFKYLTINLLNEFHSKFVEFVAVLNLFEFEIGVEKAF